MTPPASPLSDDLLLRLHHGETAGPSLTDAQAHDPVARQTLADWQAQDAALAALFPDPGPEIPPALRRLLDEAEASRLPLPRLALRGRMIAAGIALFALGAATGWLARPHPAMAEFDLPRTALAAHMTYVSEIAHPVEVSGSDRDHLLRWLSKRLGQPIHAPDLGAQGFQLLGGRLLPGEPHPAALLMYENDAGLRLTIYVIPDTAANSAFRHVEEDGQQGVWWTDDGLGCAIIGPLDRKALQEVAQAAYDQLI